MGETMYCPSCGGENERSNEYCRHCGEHLNIQSSENRAEERPGERSTTGEKISRTSRKIIGYLVGFMLLSLAAIVLYLGPKPLSYSESLFFVAAGLIALPIVRTMLRKSRGINLSTWQVAIIVLLLFSTGLAHEVRINSAEADGNPEPNTDPELIEESPDTLLPTIQDFENGWREREVDDPNKARFYSVQASERVVFTVSVHDSVSAAKSELESRRPENTATDKVDIGDAGYLHSTPNRGIIEFREKNVVGHVEYVSSLGPSPERNAKRFARMLHDSITN